MTPLIEDAHFQNIVKISLIDREADKHRFTYRFHVSFKDRPGFFVEYLCSLGRTVFS